MSDSTSQIVIAMAVGVIGALIICHVMGNQLGPDPISTPVGTNGDGILAAPVISTPPVQDKDAKKGQYHRVVDGNRGKLNKSDRAINVMPPNTIKSAIPNRGQQLNADQATKAAPGLKPSWSS
jgi:hypothetical protein